MSNWDKSSRGAVQTVTHLIASAGMAAIFVFVDGGENCPAWELNLTVYILCSRTSRGLSLMLYWYILKFMLWGFSWLMLHREQHIVLTSQNRCSLWPLVSYLWKQLSMLYSMTRFSQQSMQILKHKITCILGLHIVFPLYVLSMPKITVDGYLSKTLAHMLTICILSDTWWTS